MIYQHHLLNSSSDNLLGRGGVLTCSIRSTAGTMAVGTKMGAWGLGAAGGAPSSIDSSEGSNRGASAKSGCLDMAWDVVAHRTAACLTCCLPDPAMLGWAPSRPCTPPTGMEGLNTFPHPEASGVRLCCMSSSWSSYVQQHNGLERKVPDTSGAARPEAC